MPNVSTLGSFGDLSASQIAGASSQLVPSGVVMAFAGATAPSGWLLCNGSVISRTTYANLFAAISTAHGSGDGSTTFALPNYAGQFLRGRANGSANDPDRASRTAAASGGNTGDAVGSIQSNATAKNGLATSASNISASAADAGDHFHTYTTNSTSSGSGTIGASGQSSTLSENTSSAGTHTHTITGTAAAQTITGDNETRPLNAYVNYIIKI